MEPPGGRSRSSHNQEEPQEESQIRQLVASSVATHSNDEISSLKMRRNSLSPVSRLPPELLSQIFMFLIQDYWEEKVEGRVPFRPQWVVVTHICQAWRATFLNTPQLWSRLECFSSKWAGVQLERSMGVGLHLRIPEELSETEKQRVLNVLAHSHRLRSIDNTVQLPVVFSKGRPDIFDLIGSTPQLRQLNLKGWILLWTSPLFSGLTTLKLNAGFSTDTFGNLSSFLDALERMPSLVELKLEWITGNIRGLDDVANGSRIIRLEQLRKLSLQVPIHECTAIVAHLSYPISTRVHVQTVPLDYENRWFESEELGKTLIPALTTSLYSAWNPDPPSRVPSSEPKASSTSAPDELSIRCMSILLSGGGARLSSAVAFAWFEELDFTRLVEDPAHADNHIYKPRRIPPLNLCVGIRAWRESGLDLAGLGHHLITSLPLTKLGAVSLDGGLSHESIHVLGKLPSLCSMHLQEQALVSFLHYTTRQQAPMEQPHPQSSDTGHNTFIDAGNVTTPFPKLVCLSIDGVDFGVSDGADLAERTAKAKVDDLLTFLRFRRDVFHLPIKCMRLFDTANLSEGDLANITSLVAKVVRDSDRKSGPA